jgi:hypothetical protein
MKVCHHCGNDAGNNYVTRKKPVPIFSDDDFYHEICIKELFSNHPSEKYTRYGRLERLLNRASKNKILTPLDIKNLESWFRKKIGVSYRCKEILHFRIVNAGYLNGKPLADLFENKELYDSLWEFFREFEKLKRPKSGKMELGVLLTILGVRNAIKKC